MAYLNAKYHANQITVNTPQWKLTIGDTQTNREVLMVFLRSLQEPAKKKPGIILKDILKKAGFKYCEDQKD